MWALKELENGALFVNSDETYHSIGDHPHKKQKISCWKGEPAETLAISAEDVKFTYMFWGGCCEDCSIPRPFFIWEEETDAERAAAQDELDIRNAEGCLEVERKRAKALVPGTPEWALLQHHNDLIDRMNANRRARFPGSRKGIKRHKKPEHIFKWEKLERSGKRNGIDWYLYEKHILKPLLYPYCERLQELHPERQVWLIEDNASIHTKAEWTAAQHRIERGVRKAPWPPNSPDLHPIENLWDYEKDIIGDEPVHGASESEKNRFKELTAKEWLAMDGKVKQCMGTFKDKLERCIKANGDNNFHG